MVAPPPIPAATETVGAWLLLKAFASGCTALTGVEAVSNGVVPFAIRPAENARKTLTVIIGLLIILLAGIAWLVKAYNIAATDPGAPGYQSVLSMLVAAVTGQGVFLLRHHRLRFCWSWRFRPTPRLRICRACAASSRWTAICRRSLANRGRRLVFSEGILVLAVLDRRAADHFRRRHRSLDSALCRGRVPRLHASRNWAWCFIGNACGGAHAGRYMFINGLGGLVTGITVLVVLVAKFVDGAWITMFLIPGLLLLMYAVHRHYGRVSEEVADSTPLDLTHFHPAQVVVPIERWSAVAKKALIFALSISPDVIGVHVNCEWTEQLKKEWQQFVEKPAQEIGLAAPRLVIIDNPYRYVTSPIVDYVLGLQKKDPDRQLAVLIPELVERHWYYYFLHNQRAAVLKTLLYVRGSQRIAVVNVPWYIE